MGFGRRVWVPDFVFCELCLEGGYRHISRKFVWHPQQLLAQSTDRVLVCPVRDLWMSFSTRQALHRWEPVDTTSKTVEYTESSRLPGQRRTSLGTKYSVGAILGSGLCRPARSAVTGHLFSHTIWMIDGTAKDPLHRFQRGVSVLILFSMSLAFPNVSWGPSSWCLLWKIWLKTVEQTPMWSQP